MTNEQHHTSEPNDTSNKWDDSEFHQTKSDHWIKNHKPQVSAFSGLLIVLLLVIFALPKLVTSPQTDSPASDNTETKSPIADNSSVTRTAESPWEEAQLTKARREAQDILAKLLDQQSLLESMRVELWGQDQFQDAMNIASMGDEHYQQGEFNEAQTQYLQALQQFESLVSRAEEEFEQAISMGNQAIEAQQVLPAREAFTLATQIHPDSAEAEQGLARAQVLEQVLELLDDATNEQSRSLEKALASTQQALSLDPNSKISQDKLPELKAAINDRDFSAVMGQGYSALYEMKFNTAIKSFQQALKLKPQQAAAKEALTQARNQQTQSAIESAITRALKAEENEQWQQATEHYQRALKWDSSLVKARIGEIRSTARHTLDSDLKKG